MSHTTVNEQGFGFNISTLGPVHWIAIFLAALTGVFHLYLFVEQGWIMFLLAGLGFFGAIGLLIVTYGIYRQVLYLVGIPYTLAQIAGYVVIETPESLADMSTFAIVDKIAQVLLIILLAYLFVREWDGL